MKMSPIGFHESNFRRGRHFGQILVDWGYNPSGHDNWGCWEELGFTDDDGHEVESFPLKVEAVYTTEPVPLPGSWVGSANGRMWAEGAWGYTEAGSLVVAVRVHALDQVDNEYRNLRGLAYETRMVEVDCEENILPTMEELAVATLDTIREVFAPKG